MPCVATEQVRAEHLAALSGDPQAVPQGGGARRQRVAAVPLRAVRRFRLHVCAAAIIPSMGTRLPFSSAADAIALVGLLATARVFVALAAMDIGTAFGSLGARREMMVGFLAEPALLMVIFVASLLSSSTALPAISDALATAARSRSIRASRSRPSRSCSCCSPRTRESPSTIRPRISSSTMIHEATLLEYSARHLALMEWAASLKLFNYACIGFALFVPWGVATAEAQTPAALLASLPILVAKLAAAGVGLALIETVSAKLRVFRAPEFLRPPSCSRARPAREPAVASLTMSEVPFDLQILNALAALFLLLAFAMLAQRRVVALVSLLAFQGGLLCAATLLLAYRTGQMHLYVSALLTLALKVVFLPWAAAPADRRLDVYWDSEPLINTTATMLLGLLIVIFSFGLAQPIAALASTATRNAIGIAVAVVLLAFLTMITRRKSDVAGRGFSVDGERALLRRDECDLRHADDRELGVALDILVAMLVLGVFFFQIREQFDSLDLQHSSR